ncbi:MAG: NUDIX hydrolase [Halorientalis sp.]
MGVAGRSRDHVEELISDLESAYDSFPINQTTVTVPAEHYERVEEQCRQGVARVDVYVRNEQDDVLMVEDGNELTVPGETVTADDSLERRARRAVKQATGVECHVETILKATIAGVHSEADPDADPIYRLVVLLSASLSAETPSVDGQWQTEPPGRELVI